MHRYIYRVLMALRVRMHRQYTWYTPLYSSVCRLCTTYALTYTCYGVLVHVVQYIEQVEQCVYGGYGCGVAGTHIHSVRCSATCRGNTGIVCSVGTVGTVVQQRYCGSVVQVVYSYTSSRYRTQSYCGMLVHVVQYRQLVEQCIIRRCGMWCNHVNTDTVLDVVLQVVVYPQVQQVHEVA